MYRTDFWTLWEKASVGYFERSASKHVYYLGWNRSPAQVGCMRQVLGPGTLGKPRRIGWKGKWEGGSGWGIHVNPWLIHVNVWQKPLQYCRVISLQLIKINEKKCNKKCWWRCGDTNHHILLVGMSNGAVGLENNLAVLQRAKHWATIWPSNFTPRCAPERNGNICPLTWVYRCSQQQQPQSGNNHDIC